MSDSNYINLVGHAFRSLNQCNDHPEMNTRFTESLDELLEGVIYGIFRFDSLSGNLIPFHESSENLESMGLEKHGNAILEYVESASQNVLWKKSFTLVPLCSGKQVIGCIVVKIASLSEEKAEAVALIGRLWVQRRNYLELEQNNSRLARELGRSLHNFSVVRSIAQAVSKAQDMKHLLALILNVAITTVNASKGFIMLENENTRRLELKVAKGLSNQEAEKKINAGLLKGAGISAGDGIQGRVMESQQPVLLTNVGEDSGLLGFEGQTNSLMCVPLLMNDTAFGVIYLTNKEGEDPFEKDDLDVLSILASHASAVLDQARLYTLATTDELTGLYTRRYYTQRIGDEFKRAMRYQRHLGLVVLDIDHFKNINDTYGHEAGDYVLQQVARIIKYVIRNEVDAAVRFGGEEFVLILPETHLRGAFVVGERVRKAIESEKMEYAGNKIPITISGGVSSYPENGAAIEDLFNISDRALYQSKSSGRNKVSSIPDT